MGKPQRQDNPFNPDAAAGPAHLAGRDMVLRSIELTLSAIVGPRDQETGDLNERGGSYAAIQIYGPRGSGKSALMTTARRMAEERGVHVVRIASMPDLDPDGELVAGMLARMDQDQLPEGPRGKLAQIKKLREKQEGLVLDRNLQASLHSQILKECVRQRPLAILMEHVTSYDVESLRTFLLYYESMLFNRCPVALLLAGTPNMFWTLDKTRVGFVDRCDDFHLDVLAPAATREALRQPFEERGVKVRDEALELLAGMTDDYPYFIQIAGAEVWDTLAAAGRNELDEEIVRQAEAGIVRRKDGFNQNAYAKMKEADLIGQARLVMELLWRKDGQVRISSVIKALTKRFPDHSYRQVMDAFHALVDCGFICEREAHTVEAGIPSFFKYFEDKQQAKVSKKAWWRRLLN